MYVSSLSLNNFRNYEKQYIEFSSGTNVFCGHNAQGKTNILEAIYMFCRGKSIRAKHENEIIRFGKEFYRLDMSFFSNERINKGIISADTKGRKAISINNIPITKFSMLMSYFNAVFFNPEDLGLIKGAPSQRRRFMDSSLSQLYPGYLSSLINYNKSLMQKNSLLRQLRKCNKHSDAALSAWNEILSDDGAKIMRYRQEFADKMNVIAAQIQKDISGECLKTVYSPGVSCSADKEEYYVFLEEHSYREIELGSSKYGIQRDDIDIFINDKEARLYSSQGQQRTAALALKIAQGDFISDVKNEYPVLLLDDIMSELDINRRRYLWERIERGQVIITCTDTDSLEMPGESKIFYVENGKIKGG